MAVVARRTAIPFDVSIESPGTILDILHKYQTICANEFCGKCMPCRYGTKEEVFIIDKIILGQGTMEDYQQLKTINKTMKTASFCMLGLRSPYVIDALFKYYGTEITDFIEHKTPMPKTYTELPKFLIKEDLCNGCPSDEKAPCKQVCAVNSIDGDKGALHIINQAKCYRCDECVAVCPTNAISFV